MLCLASSSFRLLLLLESPRPAGSDAALGCRPLEERREVEERAADLSAGRRPPSRVSKSMTILSPVDLAFLKKEVKFVNRLIVNLLNTNAYTYTYNR